MRVRVTRIASMPIPVTRAASRPAGVIRVTVLRVGLMRVAVMRITLRVEVACGRTIAGPARGTRGGPRPPIRPKHTSTRRARLAKLGQVHHTHPQ
jgi:hypothetical protein